VPYFIYILKSDSTSRYYIGHTDNLDRRISEHNNPDYHGTQYTKRHAGPWTCVYTETYETRAKAIQREKELKAKKSKKHIEFLTSSGKSR
jgi:putative endonuclease